MSAAWATLLARCAPSSAPRFGLLPRTRKSFSASVDEILDFASKDTGFPKHSQVKRQLIGRDRVDAYIAQELSKQVEEDRLGRSELVLKKIGLLPADFALKKLFC